jgi:hypothetical protein
MKHHIFLGVANQVPVNILLFINYFERTTLAIKRGLRVSKLSLRRYRAGFLALGT